MAAPVGSSVVEGQSTNRPPLFNGTNYGYWKARMRIFIQAQDYEIWKIIIKGPYVPMKIIDGISVPKPEEEWDEVDIKKVQVNAKAMNTLYCALDPSEFNRISICSNAKEIWDRLEVTHEGTSQVKESKISLLVHKYEMFKIEGTENITDMFTRFNNIISELKNLGKVYTNHELVQKLLRALPSSWEAKVTAIEEAKDLNKITLDELRGSLLTHELKMKDKREEEENRRKRTVAFKAATEEEENKKKKSVAFKAATEGEESCSTSEDDTEDELALVTKKFRRFYRRKRQGFRKRSAGREETNKEKGKEPICYECKRPGHLRTECPQLKKTARKFKKKAMAATWSDSDESSEEEE